MGNTLQSTLSGGNPISTFHKTIADVKKNDASFSEIDFTNFKLGDSRISQLTEALRTNNSVQRLVLTNTDTSATGVQILSDTLVNSLFVCNIHTLILDNNPIGPDGAQFLGMAIGSGKSLLTLKVNGCGLGDDGIIAVARGLQSNRTLLTLEIGNNGFGDRGAQAVAKMLKSNDVLEGLSMWRNNILAAGAKYIFVEGLANNSSLLWLGLGGNNIGPEGAGYVASGLATNDCLQWLALGGNDIGDQGALKIGAVLKDDGCVLQSVGLGGNNITDAGVVHITKALWSNSFLESLGLGGNAIGAEGCEHISEMLKANKVVKKLILSSNLVDDDGIRAVSDGLAVNSVLTTLLVAGNPFGDVGAQYLIDKIVSSCPNLTVLDIHGTNMNENIERAIVEKARISTKLVLLGSLYGRRDHRIVRGNESTDMRDQYKQYASPTMTRKDSMSNMRGEEQF